MKIIFLGTSGVHYPLVAANIFLDRLQEPDFRFTRGFADTFFDESGLPIYIDEDRAGNHVYSLGVGPQVDIGLRSIEDLTRILECGPNDLALKAVTERGANLLYYLGKMPKLMGGSYLNKIISNYLLKRDFARLKEDVHMFKKEIYSA